MYNFYFDVDLNEIKVVEDEIYNEVNQTVHDIGDVIFAESQMLVNVKEGILKDSGNIIHGEFYSLVGYNTPYAQVVHDGFDGVQEVREHMRRSKKGNVHRVRAHYRYVERIGNPYLDAAIEAVTNEVPLQFPDMAEFISITRIGKDVDIG